MRRGRGIALRLATGNLVNAAILGCILAASPVVAAAGSGACPVCGAAVTDSGVAVTDWETNQEYSYHDLSCAVRDMAARFPWSRATAKSAASGQTVTLSRINGTWRAQPEEAVAVLLSAQGRGCGNAVVFANPNELREYRDKHRAQIPVNAQPVALASLPGFLLAAQPVAISTPSPGQTSSVNPPVPSPEGPAPSTPAAARRVAAPFKDVPPNHWAAGFVEKARSLGLLQGYPDGTFRGNERVTRYELAAIIARLAESGGIATRQETTTTAPSQGAPVTAAPPAAEATVVSPPEERELKAEVATGEHPSQSSLLGLSGLMTVPNASTRNAGDIGAMAGVMNGKFLGAGAVGIGDGIELAATSARVGGDDRVFVSAKKRLERLSRPGLDTAVGFTGLGNDTAAFAAATKQLRLGGVSAKATLGVGTGGILDGVFAGAAVPLKLGLVPFAKSAELVAESVDNGDGRNFNYGVDLGVRPDLDLKIGSVEGRFAAGLALGRRF
jgi:hypothetical protein